MREGDFIFDSVRRGDLQIVSPDRIKNEKATANEDDKCFYYAATVTLNYEEIKYSPDRVSNIKPFINKLGRNKLSQKIDDWKRFEKNKPTIAFNILYTKEKEILPAYISKHNLTCEKQIILLIIPNEEKAGWNYLAVEKLSALLHKKTSKHKSDFYCLNCINFGGTERKLKIHEKMCKNKDFCGVEMPSERNKVLKFNQYMKSDKMPYIIYADLESLIEKIDGCANNPEKSLTTKIGEHIPCGYSMSTSQGFDHIKNKHTLYHEKDCRKKLCESLREHAKSIIDFEKKKMLPLTRKKLKSHQDAKVCYIWGTHFIKKHFKDTNYRKVRDHCHYTGKYRGPVHMICNLKFNVLNEIL